MTTCRMIAGWMVTMVAGALVALAADAGIRDATAGENFSIEELALELIWVAPGTFTMGSPREEARHKSEGPQTEVTLTKGFWLGKTELTQAQYEAVMGMNPSHFKDVSPQAPVERVSWEDAMEFCRVLTERERRAGRLPEGYAYTLPTEAQWEYARRAGAVDVYISNPHPVSWFEQNSGGTTHPVGLKQANEWGFHDMSGNVLEWCLDWFGDYAGGAVVDPRGPGFGHFRIARGGSWRVDEVVGRPAARAGGSAGRRDYTMGFRLALSAVNHGSS